MIYALFPQFFVTEELDSANFYAFRMCVGNVTDWGEERGKGGEIWQKVSWER